MSGSAWGNPKSKGRRERTHEGAQHACKEKGKQQGEAVEQMTMAKSRDGAGRRRRGTGGGSKPLNPRLTVLVGVC